MSSIDERVVQMEFDNDQFEKGIKQSIKSLDDFKKSLKLEDATKSLTNLEKSASKISLEPLTKAAETVSERFSTMGIVAMTSLTRIANTAIDVGHQVVNHLITPIRSGFQEYETQINAVQTILSNTRAKGTTLDQVNEALDELNHYADLTIYNFTEMTRNIGTFTAAGVDLDTSVSAIKGIANLAAVSGSTSEQASRAMYQLSQALASGTVKLQDWNSVVNAGMGGEVFKNALIETARVHGVAIDQMIKDEGSFRETLSQGWLTTDVLLETLNKFTGDLTKEQLISIGYTEQQAQAIIEMGDDANKAATKVKTVTQLFDTLSEAAQSGWTQSWEILIGDFEEARELLTGISDVLSDIINARSNARNSMLEQVFGTKDGGKAIDSSKWEAFTTGYDKADQFKERIIEVAKAHGIAIDDMIAAEGSFEETLKNGWLTSDILNESMANVDASAEQQTKSLEEYQRIVAEIWNGNWGNGQERFDKLAEAGYDYAFVQQLVNLAGEDGVFTWEELTDEQKELINTLAESDDAFKDLRDSMQDNNSAISQLMEGTQGLTGREKLIQGFTKIWEILTKVFADIAKVWNIVFPDKRVETLNGIIDAFYNWATALEYSDEAARNVKLIFTGLFSAIAIVVDVVKAVALGFKNFFDKLPKGNGGLIDFIANIGLLLGQFRQFLLREGAFEKITETVTNFLMEVGGFFTAIINDVKALFSGEELNFVWLDTLRRWFNKIWDAIKKINFEPFNNFIDKAKEFFKDKGLNFEWVGSVKKNVQDGMKSIGETFTTWAESVGLDTSGPLEFIESAFDLFIKWFNDIDWSFLNPVKEAFESFWNWLTSIDISELKDTALTFITNAFDGFIQWFNDNDILGKLNPIDGVRKALETFNSWFIKDGKGVEKAKGTILDKITTAFDTFISWGSGLLNGGAFGFIENIQEKIRTFIEWIKNPFKAAGEGSEVREIDPARMALSRAGGARGITRGVNASSSRSILDDIIETGDEENLDYKDTILGKIQGFFTEFLDWFDQKKSEFDLVGTVQTAFSDFLNYMSSLTLPEIDVEGLKEWFGSLGEGIGSFATGLFNAIEDVDVIEKIKAAWEELKTLFQAGDTGTSWFEEVSNTLSQTLAPLGEAAGEFLSNFMSGVQDFVGEVHLSDVMSWLIQGLWGLAAFAAAGGIGTLVGVSDGISEWFEALTGGNKWIMMGQAGKGLLGMALALMVFDSLDNPGEALKDVGIALVELFGAQALGALLNWKFGVISMRVGSLGTALIGLATAAVIFSNITPEDTEKVLDAIERMMNGLEFMMLAGSGWSLGGKLEGGGKFSMTKTAFNFSAGIGLMAAAVAVGILSWCATTLGDLSLGSLAKGVIGTGLLSGIISGMAVAVGVSGFNLGKGIGTLGLSVAVGVMVDVANKIHNMEITDQDAYALIGFSTLVTLMAVALGLTDNRSVDMPGGGKKTITGPNVSQGFGRAIETLGLVEAVRMMAETVRTIHGMKVDSDDILHIIEFSTIVTAMGALTSFGSFEYTSSKGGKTKSFDLSGKGLGKSLAAPLKTLGLVEAVDILGEVAEKIHNATIDEQDVDNIQALAFCVANLAVVAGGGSLSMGKGKGGVQLKSATAVGSIFQAFETMELVEAIGVLADTAVALANPDLDPEAIQNGVEAVIAIGNLVGQLQIAMGFAQAVGGNTISAGVTSLFRSFGTGMNMYEVTEAINNLVPAMIALSYVDHEGLYAALIALGLGMVALLAGGTISGIPLVARGMLVFSIAVKSLASALGIVLQSFGTFVDAFIHLYDSMNPKTEGSGGKTLTDFSNFVDSMLEMLEQKAAGFGEKGFNIAAAFLSGVKTAFDKKMTVLVAGIASTVHKGIYDTGLTEFLHNIGFLSDADYNYEMKYVNMDLDEYEKAIMGGYDINSPISYLRFIEMVLEGNDTDRELYDALELEAGSEKEQKERSKIYKDFDKIFELANSSEISEEEFLNKELEWLSTTYGDKDSYTDRQWSQASEAVTEQLENRQEYYEDIKNTLETLFSEGQIVKGDGEDYITDIIDKYGNILDLGRSDFLKITRADGTSMITLRRDTVQSWIDYYSELYGLGSEQEEGYEKAKENGEQTFYELTDDFETYSKTVYGDGMDLMDEVLPKVTEDGLDYMTAVSGLIDEMGTDLLESGGNFTDAAETNIQDLRNQLEQYTTGNIGNEILSNIENPFERLYFDAVNKFETGELAADQFAEYMETLTSLLNDEGKFQLDNATTLALSALGVDTSQVTDDLNQFYSLIADEAGNLVLVQTGEDIVTGLTNALEASKTDAMNAGTNIGEAVVSGVNDGAGVASPSKKTMQTGLYIMEGLNIGVKVGSLKLYSSMKAMSGEMVDKIRNMGSKMVNSLREFDNAWKEVGKNSIKGFIKGMTEDNTELINAAKQVAQRTLDAAKEQLQVQSPSKKFEEVGMYADMGLAQGLTKYSYLVENSSVDVADGSMEALRGTLSNMAAIINGEVDVNPTIAPVLDLSGVRASSAQIGSLLNSRSGYLARQANGYFTAARNIQNGKVDARNSDVVAAINELNSHMDGQIEALSNLQVVMNTGALVGQIKRPLDRRLGEMAGYRERGI